MPNREDYGHLLAAAKAAAEKSYAPYSHYRVGAAVMTDDGAIFTGCNVENASYGAAICAERTALVKAVSEGHTRFRAVAVICGQVSPCWPCGICRQFISEFGLDIKIVVETDTGTVTALELTELLPHSFGPKDLRER